MSERVTIIERAGLHLVLAFFLLTLYAYELVSNLEYNFFHLFSLYYSGLIFKQ